jgi:hypothetical protein
MFNNLLTRLFGDSQTGASADHWDSRRVELKDAGSIQLDDAGIKTALAADPASVFAVSGHISLAALTTLAEHGTREFHLLHTRDGKNFLVACGESVALSCGDIQKRWGSEEVTASIHTHHKSSGRLNPKPSFTDLWSTENDTMMRHFLVTPVSAIEYQVPVEMNFREVFEVWLRANAPELELKPNILAEQAFGESSREVQIAIMLRFHDAHPFFCKDHDASSLERVINSTSAGDAAPLHEVFF